MVNFKECLYPSLLSVIKTDFIINHHSSQVNFACFKVHNKLY